VEATFDGAGNLTSGRFRAQGETEWRDAEIDSPYVVGADGTPEDNLWVKATWDGVSTTQTATVRVREGVASSIRDTLEAILDPTEGMLHNLEVSYRDIITQIDARVEAEERRIEQLEEHLTARYSRLEDILVQMQGQQSWLESVTE
jgi:flagellar hook-associated protein 2